MMRASGRLDDPSPVKPEMQGKGRPESYITGGAGEGEPPGQLGASLKPATPKACDVRGNSSGRRRHSRRPETKGQPEDSDAGSAERERGRGNPETQPGQSGKIEEAGQPAASSAGRMGPLWLVLSDGSSAAGSLRRRPIAKKPCATPKSFPKSTRNDSAAVGSIFCTSRWRFV